LTSNLTHVRTWVWTFFRESAKNGWSVEKHPLHPFFDILLPSPGGFSTKKKSVLLGRGAGVRAGTLTVIAVDTVPVDGLGWKKRLSSRIVDLSELKSGLRI
jgi:hypothetical protein